jgi:phage gp46-like protein
LQSGFIRTKRRDERRPELPRESALEFYPRYWWTLLSRNAQIAKMIWLLLKVKRRIERDPNRHAYTDQALTPVSDEEEETFDFLTKTAGAKAAIDHFKRVHELTH